MQWLRLSKGNYKTHETLWYWDTDKGRVWLETIDDGLMAEIGGLPYILPIDAIAAALSRRTNCIPKPTSFIPH